MCKWIHGCFPHNTLTFKRVIFFFVISCSVSVCTVVPAGSRAFPVAALQIWNSLPRHVVTAATC